MTGIPTTIHWMYRLGQAFGSDGWFSHSYAIYFDPVRAVWLAYRGQIDQKVPQDVYYKEYTMRYFVFRPPVYQVHYLEYKVSLPATNVPDYYYAKIAHTLVQVSFGQTQEMMTDGVPTSQMKQWLLYS